MTHYSDDLEAIATFGLESVDPEAKITINLKDLLYIQATLQEFMRFFHQPMHYQSLEDVQKFLGSINEPKGFAMLHKSIYDKLSQMMPKEISEAFANGDFDADTLPYYFQR